LYHLDPELFENAFSNLVSNAFKYSLNKPAPLVNLQFEKSSLRITLQDFGVGIPEEDVANIFEPFYRASNVKDIYGTGLGTSIVKAYLDLIDVSIDLQSKVGEGTTFILNVEK
jgi:signal transduction histidine kinase